jgi:hypothetical protein
MPTLIWLIREQDLKIAGQAPYRLREAAPELSGGDTSTENMLTQGKNEIWVNYGKRKAKARACF